MLGIRGAKESCQFSVFSFQSSGESGFARKAGLSGELRAVSDELGCRFQRVAQSPKPKAQSPQPKAHSPKPKAQNPKPKTQSSRLKAQSSKPKTQSSKPRSPEPKAHSP